MLARAVLPVTAAIALACWMPAWGVANSAFDPAASPATLSPLDPIRLAADFAPALPMLAAESTPSAAPVDSLPPVMRRLQDEFAFEADKEAARAKSGDGSPSVAAPIAGAILGGAAGFVGGALAGYALSEGYSPDWYDEEEAVVAAIVGEAFMMPLGAHLANGTRGSFGSAAGGSLLGLLGTLGLAAIHPAAAIMGLGLQVALTVSGEVRSADRKSEERAAEAAGRSLE